MSIFLYLLNAGILLALVWLLRQQSWAQALQRYFYPALFLKLLCGVLLGLLYFHYYGGGDTIAYYNGSLILTDLARNDAAAYIRLLFFNEFGSEAFRASVPFSRLPGFTNSFFMMKLLSLLNLLTGNSYYLNSLYFSLFSFWGAAKLAAVLVRVFPTYKSAAVVAFLFFPSVVFWSSGLLKDAVLFGSMCWVTSFFLMLAHKQKLPATTLALAPVIILLFCRIKFFLALMLLPLLLLYLLVKLLAKYSHYFQSSLRQVWLMTVAIVVFGLAGALAFKVYADGFFYTNLVESYEHLLALSQGKPHIAYHTLAPTMRSFAVNAPKAIFNAIYRPFIGESGNWLFVLLALENFVLLLLSVLAVGAAWRGKRPEVKTDHVLFVAIVLAFAVIFGLSTPNFGTLSRYRIAFLPFLVYLLLQNRYAQQLLAKLRLQS
ncbi:hypothetical protein I2I11_03940 [Pontibacter sp. 172403-2]|uniref:hypothetical protein n=1 Tax=Pontibacter rufus TaxID=2791028 RepID=UPI0018AF8B8C|nr:hypothetical protein [Pontibacter sp. 172403-2]MBF9252435.1 hypothetical protein [Pontibacter sp. 172403-2]